MEKMNENDENGENLVIIIKLELENEENHNSDETVDSKVLLDTEKERSKTQIENKDKDEQRDTSLENESIGDLFCDAFEEIPNPGSLVNEEDNFVKCSARVVFIDEVSQSGTIFNYVPNLSTTPQATEPKTAGIEVGETNCNETKGISGRKTLKNKCQKCLKDFANKTSLLLHIDDKHPEVRNPRPLPCKFCDDIFTIKPRLVSHMEKVHGKSYGLGLREREMVDRDENFRVCRWCGKEYKREKALRNHERLHTGETPYYCKLCGNSFELKGRLDAHVRSQHGVSISDAHAPIVPEKNKSENNAKLFKIKAKNERWQVADKVENATTDYLEREQIVSFDDDGTNIVKKSTGFGKLRSSAGIQGCKEELKYPALKANLKNHPGEGPFCCYHKDCGKSFTTSLKLKVHERIHKKELPFACDWEGCGKKFSKSSHCKRHFMAHTGEKPHVCNLCPKRFSRADNLKKHETLCVPLRLGDPPFVCNYEECGKSFPIYPALKKHMKKHTGDHSRPHSCCHEGCGKSFQTNLKLTIHQRTHTGEKPHICNECNKKFSRTDRLENHLRTHTGEEKPLICNECNKKFSRKDHLKNHLRTHTGEKLHVCQKCNKRFSRIDHLKNHLRNHTGENPHVCKKCNKRFYRTDHLKTHTTRCVAS